MFSLLFCLLAQCSCRTQVSWKSCSNCVLQILLLHTYVASVSHKLEVCASKKKTLLQDQVQLGIETKVQLYVGISRQGKVVGKIPYTCNRLIVNQWILRSGDLKTIWWSFCLARFSLFVNKLPYQIYFLLHLIFLVICWCLHNLHAIEPN